MIDLVVGHVDLLFQCGLVGAEMGFVLGEETRIGPLGNDRDRALLSLDGLGGVAGLVLGQGKQIEILISVAGILSLRHVDSPLSEFDGPGGIL